MKKLAPVLVIAAALVSAYLYLNHRLDQLVLNKNQNKQVTISSDTVKNNSVNQKTVQPKPNSLLEKVQRHKTDEEKWVKIEKQLKDQEINAFWSELFITKIRPLELEAFVQKVNSNPKLKKALQTISQKGLTVCLIDYFDASSGSVFIDVRSSPEEIIQQLGIDVTD